MTIWTALLSFSRSTTTQLWKRFVHLLHLSLTLTSTVLTVLIATVTFLPLGLLSVAYVACIARRAKKNFKG